jgi:hypothetical protein
MKRLGTDSWDRLVFEDNQGRLWKDVNLGRHPTQPYLHDCDGEFDGEPGFPIEEEFVIVN